MGMSGHGQRAQGTRAGRARGAHRMSRNAARALVNALMAGALRAMILVGSTSAIIGGSTAIASRATKPGGTSAPCSSKLILVA